MGLIFRFIKFILKIALICVLLGAPIVLLPNIPPFTKFTAIELEPSLDRVGPLAPNGELNNAQKAYDGKVLGPEAFELYKGDLITTLASGEIVKLSSGGHASFVTKIGQPCTGLSQEHICGRPLGLQIDERTNQMYVADAYYGIWKVDLKTDKKQLLVSPTVPIEGSTPKLFNSVALAKNGDLYWTDSSSDFHLKDGAMSMLTDPSGRLFRYDAAKNQSKVLLDNLWFANGLAISPDDEFVVIGETVRQRVMKYYINGPNKGKSEVFIAGLPGTPDNLRALPDGSGVLVALYAVGDAQQPLLSRSLAPLPVLRKLVTRVQKLFEMQVEFLNSIYPHVVLEELAYSIGHFKSLSPFMPRTSGLVQLDWRGQVVASYYNTDDSLGHISDAIVFNGKLLTGAPHQQTFVGAVPAPPLLKKAFDVKRKPEVKETKPSPPKVQKVKVEEKKEAPKPTKPAEAVKTTAPPPAAQKPAPSKAPEQKKPEPVKTPPPATVKPQTEEKKAPEVKPTPKPQTQTAPPPTPTTPKPTTPKATTPKPTTSKPTTPKPETKATPSPAPKQPSPKPESKTPPKTDEKPKVEKKVDPKKNDGNSQKEAPQQIPITEEIPSDTAKPAKETLKVIKKTGPVEIPNPSR